MTSSTLLPSGYLSTSGSQIIDQNGDYVRIASVGWNQNFNNISSNVAQMAADGFNCIRLSWVDATLATDLPQIQQIVDAATANGMKVILDHHTDEAGTPADGYGSQQANGLWFDTGPGTDGTNGVGVAGTVSAAQFQADWLQVAQTFAGNSTVIGFDLDNEPLEYGNAPSAVTWGGGGPTDIHAMYQTVGNAIQAVDPGALIIAEGPIAAAPLNNFDLTQVATNPVVLNQPNKVVYSAHIYPSAIGAEPVDSGPAFVANINQSYGYLVTQHIAPVWIGEIGASLDGTADSAGSNLAAEQAWAQTMVDYLNGKDGALGGPTFTGTQQGVSTDWWDWGYNPGQYPDGILNADGSPNAAQKAIYSQFQQKPIVAPPVVKPSANNTVVLAGTTGAITDASGNKWTITSSGQVAVNGVADTSTASVKEIAYVNATVWQQNGSNLWWSKTAPSGSWSGGAGTTTSPLPPVVPPAIQPSANNTVVMAGAAGAITDASGNKWTITSSGQVAVNGVADTSTASVKEIAYVNATVWQENGSNLWWSKTAPSGSWSGGAGTATSPLPPAVATLSINVSEDAYLGDAQFTVAVDGKQVGGVLTSTTLHSSGDSDVFSLTGNWATGTHAVQIQFLNDAYGGSPTADRNLYVNSIALNGVTASGSTAAMLSNGTSSFKVGGSTPPMAPPPDVLTLHLAEDAWNGNAQFTLSIDGKQINTVQDVVALHSAGAWETLSYSGSFGTGAHTVAITFTNDAYGGSPSNDRNMYVNGIEVNGQHYGTGVTTMLSAGTANFNITTAH